MPMLANLVSTLASGSLWRHEPKLEGVRGLLGYDGYSRSSLTSRNGKELVPWFPELARAANNCRPE
jgi:bifunctional non-homologous end joining protein LigD